MLDINYRAYFDACMLFWWPTVKYANSKKSVGCLRRLWTLEAIPVLDFRKGKESYSVDLFENLLTNIGWDADHILRR